MFLTTHILLFSSILNIVMSRHMDFQERFLERKRIRALKDQRITMLSKYVLKNTEKLDDITHYRMLKRKSLKAWKRARAIEKDFRRLLAMDGMKYNYKRDLFWRTWRNMPPVNNATNQIVSYRCNNPIHVNTTECMNCGMWQTIEEQSPPCPFEFFSLVSDEKLCGANYKQYKNVTNNCPSVIKFSDLTATCDNPIETQWHFTKMYGVTQKYEDVICKNNTDFCEILTLYEITPEHVVFRIINSTNDVIYSRIMKPRKRNYICVDDCGRFNPNTRKVNKADKPLKLNLFVAKKKKKRPNVRNKMNENVTKRVDLNEMKEIVTKRGVPLNDTNVSLTKTDFSDENFGSFSLEKSNEQSNGIHGPVEKNKIKEVLNEIPPAEVHLSESKSANDYIIVSIEENTLHKGKSRRGKKESNLLAEDGLTLKPTATPGHDLRDGGHISTEEFENEGFE